LRASGPLIAPNPAGIPARWPVRGQFAGVRRHDRRDGGSAGSRRHTGAPPLSSGSTLCASSPRTRRSPGSARRRARTRRTAHAPIRGDSAARATGIPGPSDQAGIAEAAALPFRQPDRPADGKRQRGARVVARLVIAASLRQPRVALIVAPDGRLPRTGGRQRRRSRRHGQGPEPRVHGLAGSRMADASILPGTVSGNTDSPVVTIAGKAEDIIGRQPG